MFSNDVTILSFCLLSYFCQSKGVYEKTNCYSPVLITLLFNTTFSCSAPFFRFFCAIWKLISRSLIESVGPFRRCRSVFSSVSLLSCGSRADTSFSPITSSSLKPYMCNRAQMQETPKVY